MGRGNAIAPAGAARLLWRLRLAVVLQYLICQVSPLLAYHGISHERSWQYHQAKSSDSATILLAAWITQQIQFTKSLQPGSVLLAYLAFNTYPVCHIPSDAALDMLR